MDSGRLLDDPTQLLSPGVAQADLSAFLITSCNLYERFGKLQDATALLDLLDHRHRSVRRAAERALMRITAHRPRGSAASKKRRVRARANTWWRERVGEAKDWASLLKEGIKRAGHRLPDDLDSSRGIEALIAAVDDDRKYVRDNVVRLLSGVTGHEVEPYYRSQRALVRHWSRWWEQNSGS